MRGRIDASTLRSSAGWCTRADGRRRVAARSRVGRPDPCQSLTKRRARKGRTSFSKLEDSSPVWVVTKLPWSSPAGALPPI